MAGLSERSVYFDQIDVAAVRRRLHSTSGGNDEGYWRGILFRRLEMVALVFRRGRNRHVPKAQP